MKASEGVSDPGVSCVVLMCVQPLPLPERDEIVNVQRMIEVHA